MLSQPENHIQCASFLDIAGERLGINWKKHVEIDPRYFRPTEVDHLYGDASKARRILGWQPETSFLKLVEMMVDSDHALAKREKLLGESGFSVPASQMGR